MALTAFAGHRGHLQACLSPRSLLADHGTSSEYTITEHMSAAHEQIAQPCVVQLAGHKPMLDA
jgi:hypothetical protein